MTNADIKHKQGWELSVFCEDQKEMNTIVGILTTNGRISFTVEYMGTFDEKPTYLILIWNQHIGNLMYLSRELEKIDGLFSL